MKHIKLFEQYLKDSIKEDALNEFIPGTLMDMGKKPGDIWQLIISRSWAAISPGGWRMSYNANRHGKKNAEMWAKSGKDRLGNDEIDMADTYGDEHELVRESETYSDYPEAAKENAQKAIDWKEKYGRDEVTAATRVGWARAHQLSKGEAISADTVKRMSAFNRHRKNSKIDPEKKDTPWKDNGYVAWLTWGGDEGIDWAMRISKKIQESFLYESKISYSAVVLDKKSSKNLIEMGTLQPGWEAAAHHMIINTGPLNDPSMKGKTIALEVVQAAEDKNVIAAKVTILDPTLQVRNRIPHITIAVNKKNGGKASMSTSLDGWIEVKPLILTGVVKEIPFS